jgi:hypothetical protein
VLFGRQLNYLPGVLAGLAAADEAGLPVLLAALLVLFLVCGLVLFEGVVLFGVALVADAPEGDAALLVA